MTSSNIYASKIIAIMLAFSGILIYFAWDENFNMQVMFPVIVVVVGWYIIRHHLKLPLTRNLKIAIGIFCVYGISIITNLILNPEIITNTSFVRWIYSSLIAIYFAIVTDIKFTTDDVKMILGGNLFCSSVTAVLIIKNWMAGATGKISLISFFGNSIEENYTAAILAFSFMIGLFLILYVHINKLVVTFIIIAEAIIVWGLCLTGSRAAVLGIALSGIVLVFTYIFRTRSNFIKKILFVVIVIAALIVVLLNVEKILPPFIYNRLFGGLRTLNDSSNSERLDLWKYALSNCIYRPLFGYGSGNFTYYVHKIWSKHLVVIAHNTYIDFLIDSGFVGFFMYMTLIYRNIKIVFTKQGVSILPLFVCFLFTSFIVGGERTFFVWNDLFVLTIVCSNICNLNKEPLGGTR